VALRTQQIIAHESGVADTIDPMAGSYFVETLTDEIEQRAGEYLQRIDKMGGAVRAIEAGFQAREIQNAAYHFQQEVEKKRQIVVGVNELVDEQELPIELLRIDPALEEQQRQRVRAVRGGRDAQAAARAMEALDRAAAGRDNLMPFIVDAVRSLVTLGEISDVLRRRFDEYRPRVAV
ncbi:MAG: methylmalonyl-CoA mutase family protein, partial [Candidatus Binatia bacterium]